MSNRAIHSSAANDGAIFHRRKLCAALSCGLLMVTLDALALDWGEEHRAQHQGDQWPPAWEENLYPAPPQELEYRQEGRSKGQTKNPWVFAPEAVTRAENENPWADSEQFRTAPQFQERGQDSPERWKKSDEQWRAPPSGPMMGGYTYPQYPPLGIPSPLNPAYGINPIPYGAPFSVPTVPLGVGGYPPWGGTPGVPGWGTPFGRGVPGGLLWY
jgi:hypothetical protein